MDTVFSTGLAILGEIKAFAQSAKQAKKQREKLETETSSTGSMLKKLQDLVEEIGRMDDNGSSNATVSAGPLSGRTAQSLLKLDDVNTEVQSLQKAMDHVRKQLDITNSGRAKKIFGEQLSRWLRQEKEHEEIQTLLESVSSLQRSASSLFHIISTQLQAERLRREEDARREDAERRRQEAERQELEKSEKQRQELIDWLKPFDYNSKHQAATQLRQEGTCGWILENETFATWRSGSNPKFFWLHGIPGSGKTILFSKVIDDFENLANTTVAYHYCDFMNTDSIIPSTILRNIFVQLLRRSNRNWLDEFKDLSLSKKDGKSPPSGIKDLVDLIQKASRLHRRTVIAIDALDECQANSDRQTLLHHLHHELNQSNHLSVFVTSRGEHDFHVAFGDLPFVSLDDVKANTNSDIKTFISSELSKPERTGLSGLHKDLRDKITDILTERSQGLFHWVRCQVDSIEDCDTEKEILDTLGTLPKDLNQTYERILKKIVNKDPKMAEKARRILLWLVGATRPLHILELCEAITIETEGNWLNDQYKVIDPMYVLRACGSLIQSFSSSDSFDRASYTEVLLDEGHLDALFPNKDDLQKHRATYIRLSHYTVKEFLQTTQSDDTQLYYLPPAKANHDIAVLIVTYLTQDVFDHLEISSWGSNRLSYYSRSDDNIHENLSEFIRRFKVGMLFSYAWTNWDSHLLHSMNSESLYELLRRFFEKRLGQLCLDVHILRKAGLKLDVDNKCVYVLLLFAMSKGLRWLIQLLLHDSPISAHLNPSKPRSPRIMSMEKDKTNVVEALIQAGAHLNILSWYDRALFAAAFRGDLELSWVLIQAGIDPNVIDESARTALHVAASKGHLEVSTMLIQAGVDPNAVDRWGRTALHGAASRGHLEVSTMLIEAGANPNAVDRSARTALHNAASGGYLEVSMMLIQAGANPHTVYSDGDTALHVAVSFSKLQIVQVLVQASADPLSKNKSGKTPLHIAIDLHSKPTVECLLSNDAPLADLGLLYDEQVQWAQELPWYSQLKLREFDYSAPVDEEVDVIPSRSVLEARWMLDKILRLPPEVVGLILDLSEYWAHSFVWRKDQIVTSGYADVSYLSVKLRSKGSGSLRKVVFTTKSYEGTKYSNPGEEPVYDRYSTRFEVTVTSPTSRPSLERRLIQHNVSNSSISRIHVNTWEYKDHAEWMDEIHPGDLISVHARTLMWKNVVDFVRMDIYCAW